jgi:hypothetical protein
MVSDGLEGFRLLWVLVLKAVWGIWVSSGLSKGLRGGGEGRRTLSEVMGFRNGVLGADFMVGEADVYNDK